MALAAAMLASQAGQGSETAAGKTVWDGVFTMTQAERGRTVLAEHCSLCHGEAMRGGGGVPPAVGPEFVFNWNGKTVSELFTYLKTTMPPTAPGSLSDEKYADILAALFDLNGFPADGASELPVDPQTLSNLVVSSQKR